jgi:hypothetical protein
VFSNQRHNLYNLAIVTSLLALVSACSNSAAIENWLAADPQLKKNLENNQITATKETLTTTPTNNISNSNPKTDSPLVNQEQTLSLPDDFPVEIPLYPKAQLTAVQSGLTAEKGNTKWDSPDSLTQIASYYQQQLKANGWEVIQSFPQDVQQGNNALIASRENLKVTVFLSQPTDNSEDGLTQNEFTIAYQPVDDLPQLRTSEVTNSSDVSIGLEQNSEATAATTYFSDLNEVPEQLRLYVEDLATLGILTPYATEGKIEPNRFAPNEPITRRDYARWLVEANNKFLGGNIGEKIYLATKSDRPAFQDISLSNPDFSIIQGLAEAGLIPSMLNDHSNQLLFKPNAPLTREDLITWKVPLDLRKALPSASSEAIQQSWGFQDTANIDPQTLQALFTDFQNGEKSNIKRVFGYTTLFQPKKPVTRAEAAASLWYFGFQGDGITASDVLKGENSNQPTNNQKNQ